MRRTYRVPFSRAGLVGLMAALVLLCLPGTSIAGGASDTSSASQARQALLQYGAGYGKADGAPQVRTIQRTLRRLGWQPGPVDGLYGPRTEAAVTRFQSATRVATDGIVGPQYAPGIDAGEKRAAPAGSWLRAAERIAPGAGAPGQVAQPGTSPRPGGRPLRAADAGGGPTPPALRRDPGERRRHRAHQAAPGRRRQGAGPDCRQHAGRAQARHRADGDRRHPGPT